MRPDFRPDVGALKPVQVQEYLRSRGWSLTENLSDSCGMVVYRRDDHEVEIPQRPEFADYVRRVQEAIEIIADGEGKSVATLLEGSQHWGGGTRAAHLDQEGAPLVPVRSLGLRDPVRSAGRRRAGPGSL